MTRLNRGREFENIDHLQRVLEIFKGTGLNISVSMLTTGISYCQHVCKCEYVQGYIRLKMFIHKMACISVQVLDVIICVR